MPIGDYVHNSNWAQEYKAAPKRNPPTTITSGGHNLVCIECKGSRWIHDEKENTLRCNGCERVIKVQAKVRESA